jgi:hypothetical protein
VLERFIRIIDLIIYVLICIVLLTASNPVAGGQEDRARAFTRPIEFDYVSWSANAALLKLQTGFLGLPGYLAHEDRKQAVLQYMFLTERILRAEDQLNRIYADPEIEDKETASTSLRALLDNMYARQQQLAPLAEATLQAQVSAILAEQNLTTSGQPVPPVLYHISALPMGLIISPRNQIEQITNISVLPDLTVDQQAVLEEQVDAALDVSSLVVPIGGVAVYPSMVMRTTSLHWLADTVAHEWTHNYLTLRPLGFLYDTTPELRTMNETAASIVGGEIGPLVMQRFYPELVSASKPPVQLASAKPTRQGSDGEPPQFDYRAEMHTTRVNVDAMLAAGKIEEAEAYMEARREIFWQNGYTIRKLNQAYFAFYGAYADIPGGAAGEDPVGPAVRALREQSSSLADFLDRISWMNSFEDLQAAIR